MAGKMYGGGIFWGVWLLGSFVIAEQASSAVSLKCDHNNNGIVDAADYVMWRENLGGQSSTLPNRDPANTGDIGISDFNSWKTNFGKTGPGASSVLDISNEATVPNAAAAGVPGLACDYSNNGVCDAADYVVWRDHLNENFQLPNEGPGVSPGQVKVDDYNFWRERFGQTLGAGSVLVDSNNLVPEPCSAALAILGALIYFGALKSRRA